MGPIPSKFLDIAEAAGRLFGGNWRFCVRWAGFCVAWSLAGLGALGGACAATLPGLFASAREGVGAWESPWFLPAVLAISAAAVGLLAAVTAAFISLARAVRDAWEGRPPVSAASYWATGWREVLTSIPFFLRAAWYWFWPAGAVTAGGFGIMAMGAAMGDVADKAALIAGSAAVVVGLVWGVGRIVRAQVAGYSAAFSGDWSRASFLRGVEMTRGKFWRAFWFLSGVGIVWNLVTNFAVGLPSGVIGSVLALAALPFTPDWLTALEASQGVVSGGFSALVTIPAASALSMIPTACYCLFSRRLWEESAPAEPSRG